MDPRTLVVELNSVCSCLDEGESGDLGLESLELIPHNLVFLSESIVPPCEQELNPRLQSTKA